MQKGIIIDLFTYRKLNESNDTQTSSPISEELQVAIQHLIYQLRETGPIKK